MDDNLKVILFIPIWIVVFGVVSALIGAILPKLEQENTIPKTCISIISISLSILILYFI